MCVIYNFRVCVRFRVLQVRSCQDVERIVALLLEVFDVIVQKPHQLNICVVLGSPRARSGREQTLERCPKRPHLVHSLTGARQSRAM